MSARTWLLPAVASCLLIGTGCTSSNSPSTPLPPSQAATGSPSPGAVDIELGEDPGAAAYRTLDVCALVPVATARQATEAASWSTPEFEPSGPARCRVTDGTDWVSWKVGAPRDRLPTAVTAPSPVSEDVDRSPQGAVVVDKACTSGHVVAAGFVLDILANTPSTHDTCSVLRTVGDAMRTSLTTGPPSYDLDDRSTSARDLCAALRDSSLPTTLGAAVVSASADDRACAIGSSPDHVASTVLVSQVPRSLRSALPEGEDRIAVSDDECTAFARVDDRGADGGGPDPYWIGLQLRFPDCPGAGSVLRGALADLVG